MDSILPLIIWSLALECLAIAATPIVLKALPDLPDRGIGICKTVGVLLFGSVIWFFNVVGIIESTPTTIRIFVAIVFLIGLYITKKNWSVIFNKNLLIDRSLWYFTFFLFIFFRLWQPEIFWGEKPMDFTFLNYFSRVTKLPPEDPWAAGHIMSYYYLGTYIFACLIKLTGIAPAIAYNLAIATLPALLITTIYTFILKLTTSRIFAIWGAVAATLFGNIEMLRLALVKGNRIGFDLSWASTRLYRSPGFNEHPLWSFCFADLHAHVIAYPFTILFFLLAFSLYSESKLNLMHRFLLAVSLGTLVGINSWDAMIALPFVCLIYFIKLLRFDKTIVLDAISTGLITALFALPFVLSTLSRPNSIGSGFVTPPEFNNYSHFLLMFGIWLLPIFIASIYAICCSKLSAISSAIAVSSSLLLYLALRFSSRNISPLPYDTLIFFYILTFIAVILLFVKELFYPALILTLSSVVMLHAEFFFLIDRMNTIFKFLTAIWALLAIAATSCLYYLWNISRRKVFRISLITFIALISLVGTTSGALCAWGLVSINRVPREGFTLDGFKYFNKTNPDEANLINWINNNVKGTPTLLEAFGISYGPFTRISMNTGLPTVLGWEHHINQRGVPRNIIELRKDLIRKIYLATSKEEALLLINSLEIKLVVVADIERQAYGPEAGKIFELNPDVFKPLFAVGNTKLFLVG